MEKRVRSPNYPALSLKEAVDKIAMVYRAHQQHPAPREVIAKALGYTGLNGASATVISAINKYGLLDGRAEDLRVSERAMSILHPHNKEERIKALRDAAAEPKLFAELAERFPGGVQNDELLKNYLLRNGFAINAVTSAIQSYRETSDFVFQEAAGYDSASTLKKEEPAMQLAAASSQSSNPTPPVLPKASQPIGDTRVLHRFDFGDGSFVEITISRDADPELALEAIEASLGSVKAVTALEAKRRKAAEEKAASSGSIPKDTENE